MEMKKDKLMHKKVIIGLLCLVCMQNNASERYSKENERHFEVRKRYDDLLRESRSSLYIYTLYETKVVPKKNVVTQAIFKRIAHYKFELLLSEIVENDMRRLYKKIIKREIHQRIARYK